MEQLSLSWTSSAEDDPGSGRPAISSDDAVLSFARVFRRMGLRRPLPDFRVEYRPYAGLRSTVHLKGNVVRVRLSDLMADSTPIVIEALAEILLAKLFRREASREARECYLAFVFNESTRRRIEETRRERGRKRQRPAQGACFDLEEIFADLNFRYFDGGLPTPRLGWSSKRSRTILGHYDSAHSTITISRLLDSPKIPRYAVEYLVFHEMLHIRYPVERLGHRRVVHSEEFRQAEQSFPYYEEARRRLKLTSARIE
ncbi:MAG TPA: SprT-like domain-containing protein [Terriglobia bacterium]|nr:SprT-like domain-containing protein [Terriglobia bacterium]